LVDLFFTSQGARMKLPTGIQDNSGHHPTDKFEPTQIPCVPHRLQAIPVAPPGLGTGLTEEPATLASMLGEIIVAETELMLYLSSLHSDQFLDRIEKANHAVNNR
jgi:hypothetical protein